MSRLKTADKAQTTYQGSAQSMGFNPQQAASEQAKTQQLKQAIVADGETISREIQRVQSAENVVLQAQQEIERSGQRKDASSEAAMQRANQAIDQGNLRDNQLFDQNVLKQQQSYETGELALKATHQKLSGQMESARTQLVGNTINSLLSFASSAIKYDQQMQGIAKEEERQQRIEDERKFRNDALLGENFWEGGDTTPETKILSESIAAGQNAEIQALGTAADEVAAGGTAEDNFMAEQIRSDSSFSNTSNSRQNVYAARTLYPSFLAEAQANGLIRPGAEGMDDIQRLTAKFAKANGLHMSDPELVADVFSRSALGSAQNTLTAVTNQAATELKAARTDQVNANVSTIVDSAGSSTAELGAAWEASNTENVNGVHNGRRSMATNRDSTEKVLKELAGAGRTGEINRLREYQYNPSRKGATLGGDMDDLFDKYEKKAASTSRTDFDNRKADQAIRIQEAMTSYMDNPTAETRQEAVTELRNIGSVDALQQADRISSKGMNRDPQAILELRQRQAEGLDVEADARQLLQSGGMNDEDAKEFLANPEQKAALKEAKTFSTGISAGMKQAMLGDLKSSNLSASMQGEWTIRHKMMMNDLNRMVAAEIKADPSIANDQQKLANTFDKASKHLLKQPQYSITDTPDKGRGFAAPISAGGANTISVITSPTTGNQDFSRIEPEQLFKGNTYPRSEMQADKDAFMTLDQLKEDVESIRAGGQPSARTNHIANGLGLSKRALIEQQLKLNGLPSLEYMESLDEDVSASQTFPGVQRTSFGPGKIGSSRFNYPQVLDKELETTYPTAYAVFNNPNSSESDLKKAAYTMWGPRRSVYRTGNIGPTSTGQHLDIKDVSGNRFNLADLDPYIEVDDQDHGTVSLSQLRSLTNNVGDSWDEHARRGSHGIDVGTWSGSNVSIKNGARLVSSTPTVHGDYTVIQIPNGKQFSFLHGDAI